ncbi:unnamed protein product [Sphenostylis stenocarpa]|uniref:Pentatricopeptide repeat-containing protein n=1 Tax=Sphenostylis stenocarpa TaxID=92480 RepID=A0AA86V8I0_9FABA|nr:unnamed protein product [Sphenostylis stenocarpa]
MKLTGAMTKHHGGIQQQQPPPQPSPFSLTSARASQQQQHHVRGCVEAVYARSQFLRVPEEEGITGTGFTRRAITAEAEEDIAAKIICEQGARTVCSSGPIRNVTIRQPPSASSLSGTDVSYEEMRESYIDGKSPSKSSEELLIGISNTLPDSQSPSNTSSKERTRELLIAISDSVPDKDEDTILNSDIMPKGKDADNFERSNDEFGPKWISSKDADDYEIANSEKFKNKIRMHSFSDAHALFDEIPQPNVVTWNTMISGYVHTGQFRNALSFFMRLDRSHVCADAFSFTSVLFACSKLSLFKLGSSIHCKTVKLSMDDSTVVANCLIDLYGKC